MKNKLSVFSILLLSVFAQLFVSHKNCFAQPPPPAPSQISKPFARPSVKNLPVEKPYVSIDLNYSIFLPEPTYSNNWIFQEGKIGINVANANVVGGKQNFKEFNQINNNTLLSKIQGKVTDEKYTETDNLYSSITFFAFDDGKFGVRKFSLSDERLYIMFAQFENSADGKIFEEAFKTFKIVGESEIKAEIQRKFEDATPQNLPQEPASKNLQSDLKEENLKGKVKKIVEESETITDDPNKKNRKISKTLEYNKAGNLTKTVRIDYRGNPDSITVYGFIEGKRVSKVGYIKYPYNPPPPMAVPSAQVEPPSDSRYSMSYEKKYKAGKLIEEILYRSNGKVITRTTYEYKDNQIEQLVYTADGKLNQKYVYLTDKNGQVLERSDFDILSNKPYGDKKYSYVYEHDKQGNWIKKTTSKEVTEDGKTFYKPLYVYYRTITYYE